MAFFQKRYPYEAFLSHAVEDRNVMATELYSRLDAAGVKIWYSANSLSAGEELEREIEQAIEDSRFGVVVLTKVSVNRPWPFTEYNWLRKKEFSGSKVVLPVIHEISFDEAASKRPGLAMKYCILSNRGMDFIVEKILEEVNDYREAEKVRKRNERLLFTSMGLILSLLITAILYSIISDRPSSEEIEKTINNRIERLQNTISTKFAGPFKAHSVTVNQFKIDSARIAYENYKSYYSNEYELNTGLAVIRSRKNVEFALSQNPADLSGLPGYGMDSVEIYWAMPTIVNRFQHLEFSLINKRPVKFKYEDYKDGSMYIIRVQYNNSIRYINVSLNIPPSSTGTKRHEMTLLALPPSETFYFEKRADGDWYFKEIR